MSRAREGPHVERVEKPAATLLAGGLLGGPGECGQDTNGSFYENPGQADLHRNPHSATD